MSDKIQPYRQPLVTATGILLGFILNFSIGWVNTPSKIDDFRDFVSLIGLVSSIIFLVITLYRVLSMDYPDDKVREYYRKTLHYFIAGLSCLIGAIFLIMIYSFFYA